MAELLPPEQAQEKALKEWELNIKLAERAHDRHAAYEDAMADTVVKDAWAAIRNLILINGGAAISILTFVGALAAKANPPPAQLSQIARGLELFAFGVAAATITAGLSYATNYGYGEASRRSPRNYVHPYVPSTRTTTTLRSVGVPFTRWRYCSQSAPSPALFGGFSQSPAQS
jgi:hypothetical protein